MTMSPIDKLKEILAAPEKSIEQDMENLKLSESHSVKKRLPPKPKTFGKKTKKDFKEEDFELVDTRSNPKSSKKK